MPIILPKRLPAYRVLKEENVFVMASKRAKQQDIRPLKIAIVNLMPTKQVTEAQLIRMLANSPIQVDLKLIHMNSHESKNTDMEHLNDFYVTLDEIKHKKYDGMIITGAPVETLPYEEVDYWPELEQIMEFSKKNVYSTLHICWGAQAGLYFHYGIDKYELDKKLFGVFLHRVNNPKSALMRGIDEVFYVPHSRHTAVRREEIAAVEDLEILAESDEAGPHIIASKNRRRVFVQGHFEYDKGTLKAEYDRDKARGVAVEVPKNYFVDDDPEKDVVVRWRANASLFYTNWLNYCVYQDTPYNLRQISESVRGTSQE